MDSLVTSLNITIQIQVAVYKTGAVCSAFLANIATSDAKVTFNGNPYHLPAWSVSILPDCKNVVLNTAKVCLISFGIKVVVQLNEVTFRMHVINLTIV